MPLQSQPLLITLRREQATNVGASLSMAAFRSCCLFAVATFLLLAVGQAVVWGPRQARSHSRGQIEPTVVEISDSSEQTLSDVAEEAIDPSRK